MHSVSPSCTTITQSLLPPSYGLFQGVKLDSPMLPVAKSPPVSSSNQNAHRIFESDRPNGGAYQKTFQRGAGGLPASLTGFGLDGGDYPASKSKAAAAAAAPEPFWNPFADKRKQQSVNENAATAAGSTGFGSGGAVIGTGHEYVTLKPRVEVGPGVGGGGMVEDLHLDFTPAAATEEKTAVPSPSPHSHVSMASLYYLISPNRLCLARFSFSSAYHFLLDCEARRPELGYDSWVP